MHLTQQALDSANALAQQLDAKGLMVRPVEGTILATLVNATSTHLDGVLSGTHDDYQVSTENLAELTNEADPIVGHSEHNATLEEVVNVVSEAVNNHLLVARTVVAPAIEVLVQAVTPEIERLNNTTMSQLDVSLKKTPAPLFESAVIESIERAQDIPVENFAAGMDLPQLESADVLECMTTGQVGVDEAIAAFVATLPEQALAEIWKNFFTLQGVEAQIYSLFNDRAQGVTNALVAFLVARKIWEDPPEGTNMSYAEYERSMVALRDQAALFLSLELKRLQSVEASGLVIDAVNDYSVTVNDAVYRRWLQEGGSNEVLFGAVLSGQPARTIEGLNAQADKYRAAWEHFVLLNKSSEANMRFTKAKDIMLANFGDSMHDVPVEAREALMQRFVAALATTTEAETHDLYAWVLRLLTSSRFYETDAFRILNGINQVKARNPGVSTRQAAAAAAVEYIAEWLASQFEVVGVTQ